ncbi:putative aspartate aminotransferase [Aspergillus nomiae NRRL 13137]|uniref:Putative aspartate aminotransferase n=1 Tax=Aspergillus nomiae NRRL (strain ATCC 15546 / NRRL 13137 / CBS 260.88 / M93) TaxID=1509407 RepID=A0A0L1IQP1_ASPN3|nr:putative aspartate aminotransferase [Aspergillus nomiae NRRL 13137]KNG81498.1 putative aspartate aminotransferase [Aspergillus nomiae NRRL 13137]
MPSTSIVQQDDMPHGTAGRPAYSLSLRASDSLKNTSNALWDILSDLWHSQSNPHGVVTLGLADNALMQEQLLLRVNSNFDLPGRHLLLNDTITGSVQLKTAIAHFLTRYLSPSKALKPSQVIVTNGVSSATEHCSWAFCDPGEGILVGALSFDEVDPISVSAVSKYEEAILSSRDQGCTIRAIMLCNPHNPLGRCHSRSFLAELMKLCQKYGIHLISDEIYALSVWRHGLDRATPMEDFTSVLSINPDGLIDPKLVHVLWGVSKDFGANGVRLGVIISQENGDLLETIRGVGQFSSISGFADYLTTTILEDEEFVDRYIKENREKLAAAYNYVVTFLDDHGIPYTRGSNAGLFVWCDLLTAYRRVQPNSPPDDSDSAKQNRSRELGEKLAQHRVHLGVGDDFGSEQPGWFRITFSQHRAQLDEGLKRIVKALHS